MFLSHINVSLPPSLSLSEMSGNTFSSEDFLKMKQLLCKEYTFVLGTVWFLADSWWRNDNVYYKLKNCRLRKAL